MWIVIPAYEPGQSLVTVVRKLIQRYPVLVVDDGSGPDYAGVFAAARSAGAVVVGHDVNLGKAAALRTGLGWVSSHAPGHPVVCADSDGQHKVQDIEAVSRELEQRSVTHQAPALILGSRAFLGSVPLRSRFGNRVSSLLFAAATGTWLGDTQTGLRGIPAELLEWAIDVPGERFVYETQMLLHARRHGIECVEVPIATVYINHNSSSHFRPIADSANIIRPMALFASSSLASAALDLFAATTLYSLTSNALVAVLTARALSIGFNFALNRQVVFRDDKPVKVTLVRYVALALIVALASYGGTSALVGAGLSMLVAKPLIDGVLFVASYLMQSQTVFAQGRSAATRELASV